MEAIWLPDPTDIQFYQNSSHLNNRNFFKYWLTSSLGYGLRAMHVAIFSGCSSHSMWSMFFCCRASASSFKVVSSAAYKLQNTKPRLKDPFWKCQRVTKGWRGGSENWRGGSTEELYSSFTSWFASPTL